MIRRVRLRADAQRDLAVAAAWYEQQQIGLGAKFLDEALSAFRRIEEQPLGYPLVYHDIRRTLMRRFPFGVFFRPEPARFVVLAVLHASRDPRRWQRGV